MNTGPRQRAFFLAIIGCIARTFLTDGELKADGDQLSSSRLRMYGAEKQIQVLHLAISLCGVASSHVPSYRIFRRHCLGMTHRT